MSNRLTSLAYMLTFTASAFVASPSWAFQSMGYEWTSTGFGGSIDSTDTSITLYGDTASDVTVETPFSVTPGDTITYDYYITGIGTSISENGLENTDPLGLGADTSVNFLNSNSGDLPTMLAAPRLIFDIYGGYPEGGMDLQDAANNADYAEVGDTTDTKSTGTPDLYPALNGLHFEIYFDSDFDAAGYTAQLRIWDQMGTPVGDPIFDSVESAVPFLLDSEISTMRIAMWNSPDQYVTLSNLTVIQGDLPEGLSGDFNGDGKVDLADYTVWRNNLGATETATLLAGNGDGLGVVDTADYALWKAGFGTEATTIAAAATVPEPSTVLLAGALLACLGLYKSSHR